MGTRQLIGGALNAFLKPLGYRILSEQGLYEWQKGAPAAAAHGATGLPAGASDYLRAGNPVLRDLIDRYSRFDAAVTTPLVWNDDCVSPEEMLDFRGDNAYVWQVRHWSMNVMAYALTYYYLKSIDSLGLLDRLAEDGAFGAHVFSVDGKDVSRDLLDSIAEIYFLERHLALSSRGTTRVLDIGAGYGRLAHRMTTALTNVEEYCCADAVAVSTFIADYYLRFRGLQDRSVVIPLDKIEEALGARQIDLAINIHSFSECRPPAIDWWMRLVAKNRVRHLMIVPNTGAVLRTNDGIEFSDIVARHGYRLVANEPKYRDKVVQEYGINPSHHFLFELR